MEDILQSKCNENYKLSRFTLGTAQLGISYGEEIDNIGKPSYKEAHSILKFALDNGINVFDTAPDYGDSEEIIGKFLSSYPKPDIYVSTKLECHHYGQDIWKNKEIFSKRIREDFNLSCTKLSLDKIPIYLVHDASLAFRNNGVVLEILNKIKNEGRIGYLGVSLQTGEELKKCIEDERVEVVQIPFNILNRRFAESGLIDMARKRGIVVFSRNTYLKGLLCTEPERIPKCLNEAVAPVNELNKIAKENNLSIKELCMKYVLSLSGIDSIVIGVKTVEQIKENIKILESEPLEKEIIEAIDKIKVSSEYILNPWDWPIDRG
jgi:aryl-alcohol dehydrogenase-like predicted oxidoreductase